ncbi:EG45-like domain containing protein-like [Hibiscus syriacus]|uniref:EG45-like domain containing protein-like n=1 Tax=Hibiscus syriacus TaxID=106335 RepID=A0A6A3ARD9_HIBSY|nr:EG45-like domain containing protein-like [Hibiscus syriacus]
MLKKQIPAFDCFGKPSEREPMIVNSLTTVSNVLNVTAQQRKSVRLTICPQVTQHKIWTGALEKILNELKTEIGLLNCQFPSEGTKMGQQIVSSCLKFLDESAGSCDPDSASWIRLSPAKVVDSPRKWEDVFEMFNDLINCFKSEKDRLYHLKKIEVMKGGVSQIRDVLVDNSIGYKDARHQESLIQKKLTKTLGHSSQCLFTLLLYYLYGQYTGRILTSNEEKTVWSGVKQLERALGLFKFVWETAGMKGILELQGHLWCVGHEERSIMYRGNAFFLHGISFGPKSTSSKPL